MCGKNYFFIKRSVISLKCTLSRVESGSVDQPGAPCKSYGVHLRHRDSTNVGRLSSVAVTIYYHYSSLRVLAYRTRVVRCFPTRKRCRRRDRNISQWYRFIICARVTTAIRDHDELFGERCSDDSPNVRPRRCATHDVFYGFVNVFEDRA